MIGGGGGGVLLFPSFFCKLIRYFISPDAGVCCYPLKNNTDRLGEGIVGVGVCDGV